MIVSQKKIPPKRRPSIWMWAGVTVILIVLTAGAVYYFDIFRHELFSTALTQPTQTAENRTVDFSTEGFLTARIFVPSGTEVKMHEARIPINAVSVLMIESIITEMLGAMPDNLKGIQLFSAYKDKDNVVYLDFSGELKRRMSVGVEQEYAFLKALYQSVVLNIQGIKDVRILIDSKEAESISGHFNISRGLKEAGISQ